MGKKAKSQKKSYVKTFFIIVFSMVISFVVIAGGATLAYFKYSDKEQTTESNTTSNSGAGFISALMGKGIKVNVAVLGVDEGETRTDVIFVVHFDSKAKKLNLVSVPRDTRVSMTDEMKSELDTAGRWYPEYCKINEVHAYAGKERANEFSVKQLESLLGIKIDHYVKVNLEGFRYLVDAIGGVEVDVPQDMNYEDPYQDLYIHLKKGVQLLDGDKAEQLVRFRRYPMGDVARVSVQQVFLKEFAKKILSSDTIKNNLGDIIKTGYDYVKTDIGVLDAIKYAQYVNDVDVNNISMEVLPGVPENIGGVSYYIKDPDETIDVIDRLFYDKEPEEISADSKVYKIEILNGGNVSGLATKKKEELESEGFNITGASNYTGTQKNETRIVVRAEGMGEDLKPYFTNPIIEVDKDSIKEGTDINVILGLDETGE